MAQVVKGSTSISNRQVELKLFPLSPIKGKNISASFSSPDLSLAEVLYITSQHLTMSPSSLKIRYKKLFITSFGFLTGKSTLYCMQRLFITGYYALYCLAVIIVFEKPWSSLIICLFSFFGYVCYM